jgi:hypothetical protein
LYKVSARERGKKSKAQRIQTPAPVQHEIYDLAYFYKFSDQSNFLNCKTLDCARRGVRSSREAGSQERNMLLHLTLLFFILFYFPVLFPLHSSPLSKLTLETAERAATDFTLLRTSFPDGNQAKRKYRDTLLEPTLILSAAFLLTASTMNSLII